MPAIDLLLHSGIKDRWDHFVATLARAEQVIEHLAEPPSAQP